jgi:uncharacterized coiled-coil protein SlyX
MLNTPPTNAIGMPSADEIFDRPMAPSGWLSSQPAVKIALAALPAITDALAADVITELATTVVDLREQLDATRAEVSVLLQMMHASELKITRLRARVQELATQQRSS